MLLCRIEFKTVVACMLLHPADDVGIILGRRKAAGAVREVRA
jgi:hypothetical protein